MHQDVEQILVTEEELNKIAHRLAAQITKDYEGKKLLLIGVLKGSIYFFTDLSRYIDLPCNIDFIQASSYGSGTVSSGNINIIKDVADDLTGFDVLLVEDILDTGNTLKYIHDMLSKRNPESIGVVTLLDKPARRIADIKADYVGTDVPDAFVVGYGLDYDQYYRNLPYIGVLKKSIYEKKSSAIGKPRRRFFKQCYIISRETCRKLKFSFWAMESNDLKVRTIIAHFPLS